MPLFSFVLAGWIVGLSVAAHAAAPVWINWAAAENGETHTYAEGGYRLTLSARPGVKGPPPTPQMSIAAPGAAPVKVRGTPGFSAALIGLVRLDPKSARPTVLMQTFSGGAHCCTTLNLALLTGGAWRTYRFSFDGGPGKEIVDTDDGAPPILLIGDGNFDYTFASHAGSYLVERAYAVRGGRLYDISGEARLATRRRDTMTTALGGCGAKTGDSNGACAAYVAAASLVGQHAAAWRKMLTLYDRAEVAWPRSGCRIDPGDSGCPKGDELDFKSFPASLAWFLWRYGYAPPAPTFECRTRNCPVAWPKTPPPAGDGPK